MQKEKLKGPHEKLQSHRSHPELTPSTDPDRIGGIEQIKSLEYGYISNFGFYNHYLWQTCYSWKGN